MGRGSEVSGQPGHQSLCRWCREPLHARARVCPHCAHWQSCLTAWKYSPLAGGLILVLMLLAAGGVNCWIISRAMSHFGALFQPAPFPEELHVAASEMVPGMLNGEPVMAVVGRLRNEGPNTWRFVGLEVQFSDAAGRLIDVGREHLWPMTMAPQGEAAFRLTVTPELPAERYATHQVFVRHASTSAWFF